jgi:leucine dehydrogenase
MPKTIEKTPKFEALMRYAKVLQCDEIYTKIDPITGLQSMIAIHDTTLGPAIGGCRYYYYDSIRHAIKDVLRLSFMMTLKASISGLNNGGAKAVVIRPKNVKDKDEAALFRSFGDFVNQMQGRYVTSMDVGTTVPEMNYVGERTPYVIGNDNGDLRLNDPSPYTADGLFYGIKAAVQFKHGHDNLNGLHIAMQGAGKVSFLLAKQLVEAGATLTVCDKNTENASAFKKEFSAKVVGIDDIFDTKCDIFAPCAIGGIINAHNLKRIKAPIIAGAANNQLSHHKMAELLQANGVLYAPDFVINSGGLIYAAMAYAQESDDAIKQRIQGIQTKLIGLFEQAERGKISTAQAAFETARARLQKARAEKKSKAHHA